MGLTEVRELYSDYIAQVHKLEREKKPGDGLFGMGKKISDDPCHEAFADKLGTMLKEIEKSEPSSEEVYGILEYIYHAQTEYASFTSAYWMLNAVHSLTIELIELLDSQDAERLMHIYDNEIPRRKRFPAQKKVSSALNKRAKNS